MTKFHVNIVVKSGDAAFPEYSVVTISVFRTPEAAHFNTARALKGAVKEYLETDAGKYWMDDRLYHGADEKLKWDDIICGDILEDIPPAITTKYGFVVEETDACVMPVKGKLPFFEEEERA